MVFARIASYFYYHYQFDCYKVFTVIIYLLLRLISIVVNVGFSLYALNTNPPHPIPEPLLDYDSRSLLQPTLKPPSYKSDYDSGTLLPPLKPPSFRGNYEPISELIKRFSMLSNISECGFNGDIVVAGEKIKLPYSLLYAILLCSAISGMLAVCNSVVNTFMADRSLHNKLVALKSSTKNTKRTLSKTLGAISRYKHIIETTLLLVDDTVMPMLFAIFFTFSIGPKGVACAKCAFTGVDCFAMGFYKKYTTVVSVFVVVRVVMSIIVISKVYILEFFIWTQTGTIFDFLILRVISTIIYWGLFTLFVLTPTMFVLQSLYYKKYHITGNIPSFIDMALPLGKLFWLVIILYKIFFLVLTKIIGS